MSASAASRANSTPVLLGRVPRASPSGKSGLPRSEPRNSTMEPANATDPSARKATATPARAAAKSSAAKSNPAPRRNRSLPAHAKDSGYSTSAVETPEPEPQVLIDREAMEPLRTAFVEGLATVPDFHPGDDPRAFHGRGASIGGANTFPEPRIIWKSDKKPRQNSPDWLTATEYADTPAVLAEKVKLLKTLLLASHRTMAYTGAGLSVAAGIGMAAVGSKGGAGTGMGVATSGEPTLSHCVMAELNRQNLLHGWVQQNHDGLPQKAGYRQEDINEIHGSWFDPSNPVVKYSGSLRGDLFEDMETQADSSDLVIVLGTSLTGLNADQCVRKTARRSTEGRSLGSVIISPQRTAQDGRATLRIFAKADDVMKALAHEFGFGRRAFGQGRGIRRSADLFPKATKVLVPYDRNGMLSSTVKTYWDLSYGAKFRISGHNNIEGAHQPSDSGIKSDTVGTVMGRDEQSCSISLNIGGTNKRLGLWWLDTAQRGVLQHLPIVNVSAKEIPA